MDPSFVPIPTGGPKRRTPDGDDPSDRPFKMRLGSSTVPMGLYQIPCCNVWEITYRDESIDSPIFAHRYMLAVLD